MLFSENANSDMKIAVLNNVKIIAGSRDILSVSTSSPFAATQDTG